MRAHLRNTSWFKGFGATNWRENQTNVDLEKGREPGMTQNSCVHICMYMYMYINVCICIYIYIYIYGEGAEDSLRVRACTYVHACAYIFYVFITHNKARSCYMYSYLYVCLHIYLQKEAPGKLVCAFVCIYPYVCVYIYINIWINIYGCLWAYAYVRMYTYIHICLHTYMHNSDAPKLAQMAKSVFLWFGVPHTSYRH
jgi:hypothetical protein